jgi:hypothetical protein
MAAKNREKAREWWQHPENKAKVIAKRLSTILRRNLQGA